MQNPSTAGNSSNGKENADETSKSNGVSNVAREFNNFVNDIENLIKATSNLTGEELQKAKEKLNERISVAKQCATEMGEAVADRARKTAETTNSYVHDQPWSAVGASAAVGVLLGYVLARRH